MLDTFERQVLKASIADLTSRIAPALSDPKAAATLAMTTRLLAHVLERSGETEFAGIGAEVEALQAEEAREDAVMAAGAGAAATGSASVEALSAYVAEHLPGVGVEELEASLGGFSKSTLLLRLNNAPQLDNGLVIRCDVPGGPVESAAADEHDVIALMHRHGLPVAQPVWADRNFLGQGGTALCTRRVSGGSAFDATGSVLGPQGPQAAKELARVLAAVHAVPVVELDPNLQTHPVSLQAHIERLVSGFQSQWHRHRDRASPVLEEAFDYLLNNIPQHNGQPVIVHGDASLRNLLLSDGQASGLVDWELFHIGDHHEDLAYCRPDVEQAMPFDDFLAEYRAHGGGDFRPEVGAYFGLFGAVRNAVFGITIIHHFTKADKPEGRFAFAALYLARKLIAEVGKQLLAMKATETAHVG